MGRFAGTLPTDVYEYNTDEIRVAKYVIPAALAVAADADGILDGTALPAEAGDVTTFLAQPPYPLNLTMVCSGTQTGKATAYGKNMAGEAISEEFTLVSATPVVGAKAFASISKIALPVQVASETIDVGWGGKFGIPYKLASVTQIFVKAFNGAADTGTAVADNDELEKNTYDPNGTPDGLKAIELYILL